MPKVEGIKIGGKQETRRRMERRKNELSIDIERDWMSINIHSMCAICLMLTVCQITFLSYIYKFIYANTFHLILIITQGAII